MTTFASNLQRLLQPLTEGLRVRHIVHFGLRVCSADDKPDEVLARPELAEYDHIPIKGKSGIAEILERDSAKSKSGKPKPLVESILVSADAPLATFIHAVRNQPYRLVVDGTCIEGIVTRSDLLKAPVLMLGYSLLAQLELLANRAIDIKYKGLDEWLPELGKLDKSRVKTIEGRKNKAARENLSVPLIEHADLIDKLRVIQDFLPKGCDFEAELKELIKFRNIVDHVRQLVPSNADLDRFVCRLEIVTRWTVAIEEEIARREKSKTFDKRR